MLARRQRLVFTCLRKTPYEKRRFLRNLPIDYPNRCSRRRRGGRSASQASRESAFRHESHDAKICLGRCHAGNLWPGLHIAFGVEAGRGAAARGRARCGPDARAASGSRRRASIRCGADRRRAHRRRGRAARDRCGCADHRRDGVATLSSRMKSGVAGRSMSTWSPTRTASNPVRAAGDDGARLTQCVCRRRAATNPTAMQESRRLRTAAARSRPGQVRRRAARARASATITESLPEHDDAGRRYRLPACGCIAGCRTREMRHLRARDRDRGSGHAEHPATALLDLNSPSSTGTRESVAGGSPSPRGARCDRADTGCGESLARQPSGQT